MAGACIICGQPTTTSRAKRCPAEDCRKAFNAMRMRELNKRHRERDGVSLWQKMRPARGLSCTDCGKHLPTGGNTLTPRCRPCLTAHHRNRTRREQMLKRIAKAAAGTTGTKPWYVGHCAGCGAPLTTRRETQMYCSRLCMRREVRARRRARRSRLQHHARPQVCDL